MEVQTHMERKVREVKSLDHFGCFTDRYIIREGVIILLSMFGTATRVNALKAVILKGDAVDLQDCWTGKHRSGVVRPPVQQVKTLTRQLAQGVTHCLLYVPDYLEPEGNYPRKVFYGDSQEQLMEKFFYAAQKRYSTPLLPAWTEWLWDEMAQVEEIDVLGFNKARGVEFLEEEELEALLLDRGSPLMSGDIAANG
jgi:hypothetical protein